MRKRNVHVQFWLDKKEAEAFNKKVKRSGLSREAYLRHLVNGLVPQDAPPPALVQKIGNTTYEVSFHFSTTSRETMSDKIKRLILNDSEKSS